MNSFDSAKAVFEENGLEYSRETHEKLEVYFSFLIEYNEKINLTAITERSEVWAKHFADSIMLSKFVQIPQNASMIDVGTGAGFPSVPVKIIRPDIKLTLLDSLNKRIVFLRELCEKLGIECETVHSRAEDAAKNNLYREKFDIATARAVAAMPVLCEYCIPFVKKGGVFSAMKGPGEEISSAAQAIKVLGGGEERSVDYTLCKTEKRRLFIVKKISHTSPKFPRNSGQIKNKPL
ncbi:MAG: 16S rRNA (guanine(527)-N(7))-methyltransferase RsmG [Porcipelethomonas sp.]